MLFDIPKNMEIDYDNVSEQIQTAVKWWTTKATTKNFMNAKAGMADIFGSMVAHSIPLPSDVEAKKFADALTYILVRRINYLEEGDDKWFFALGVDYHPDHWLSMAMEYAGIKTMLPWKTDMLIDKNKVTVSEGYGSKYKSIWGEEI